MKYSSIAMLDKPLSRLVLGSADFSTKDMERAHAILDDFVALGGNTLDTANSYGAGEAEQTIGAWLQRRGNRSELTIIDKCVHERNNSGPRVNPVAIAADLKESLERLGTEYIDLYFLHRDDPRVPVSEIIESLNEHHRAGLIRAFGGSNWSTQRIQEANDYAQARGLVPFVAGSPNFSLAVWNEPPWQGCLSATVDGKEWYEKQQFPLFAWSSQAQGFFTGRAAPDDFSNEYLVRCWYNPENFERLARARELGERKGVSANVIALAYVLNQSFPIFALIGPHTREELSSSAPAVEIELTPEERRWLNLED